MSHYLSIRGIGQPIAYFPKLSIYLGCINAGVFLGQMIFWHDKTDNPLGVYKTAEEITQETGLSYKQQVNARKKLVSLGLINETYKRLDHRLFFKFNVERFDEWFTEMLLANEPNGSSRTAQTEVREEPKGQIVIQKNTTENTTEINTHTHAVGDENEWSPNLENLKAVLRTTRFSHLVDSIVGMPDFEFHLGNFNAHWENKTSLTENQKTRKFAQWITLEFEKSQKQPAVTRSHGAKTTQTLAQQRAAMNQNNSRVIDVTDQQFLIGGNDHA